MLRANMLSAIVLSVIVLSVIMLSVMAPFQNTGPYFYFSNTQNFELLGPML
jgi:hypothetical protein